jgi:hypothetical protein
MMGTMTTPPPLTPQTMERLAFIQMLHQQGIAQSRQPEPMSFACVLAFHDAIELFLMLAAEHLGLHVDDKKPFMVRYFENLHPNKLPGGIEFAGKNGVKRITDLRNGFKHANTWPGRTGIEQSLVDTSAFFEVNTPKVFGIAYDEIDMADLIPHAEPRRLVKEATAKERVGDRIEAMALLREAFVGAFSAHLEHDGHWPSPFSIGPELRSTRSPTALEGIMDRDAARQLDAATQIAGEAQAALRMLVVGIEYHAFLRFDLLVPRVDYMWDGKRELVHHPDYAPTAEDFAQCRAFVVAATLRLAEAQAHVMAPPWITDEEKRTGAWMRRRR